MRHVVYNAFWVWNFDKEEKWLNEMAAKGLCLVSINGFRYEFEDCVPGEYTIKMELLEKSPKKPESKKYLEFLEETGAEFVGSFSNWVYLRKNRNKGEFELYSDNKSRVEHLSRILKTILSVLILNLFAGAVNIWSLIQSHMFMNAVGVINIILAFIGIFGYIRISKKLKRIKKEAELFE